MAQHTVRASYHNTMAVCVKKFGIQKNISTSLEKLSPTMHVESSYTAFHKDPQVSEGVFDLIWKLSRCEITSSSLR